MKGFLRSSDSLVPVIPAHPDCGGFQDFTSVFPSDCGVLEPGVNTAVVEASDQVVSGVGVLGLSIITGWPESFSLGWAKGATTPGCVAKVVVGGVTGEAGVTEAAGDTEAGGAVWTAGAAVVGAAAGEGVACGVT